LLRIRELKAAIIQLEKHLGHAGKGAAQRIQKAGWVEDANAPEDKNGERKSKQNDVWKWKLDRKK